MANFYPGLRANMGDWTYYSVVMKMKDLAKEVRFGSEVHHDYTLDEAIQRAINESRVKNEIVGFLTRRPDRFFSSIVVAAVGGSPQFFPVRVDEDPQFAMVAATQVDQSFGVLTFTGDQKYYALDGQHRLRAIQALVSPDDSDTLNVETPAEFNSSDFENEEISVLMVMRPAESDDEAWLKSYRRLFSSLNRYAKKTDKDTDIIMDEDDVFAIITRRLISDHSFFSATGPQLESTKVLTKGKNLRSGAPQFTSLQTLYQMNEILLCSAIRMNRGWPTSWGAVETKVSKFKLFRPDEDVIDELFDELVILWDGILDAVPETQNDPQSSRDHDSDTNSNPTSDSALHWPISQEIFVTLARQLMDRPSEGGGPSDPDNLTRESVSTSMAELGRMPWDLHSAPWRGLLLTWRGEERGWGMRNEDRTAGTKLTQSICQWVLGLADLTSDELDTLKIDWQALIIPHDNDDLDSLWSEIVELRSSVIEVQ